MPILSRIRDELGFIRGSLLVLVVTWILMNFSNSMYFPYWSPFIRDLGASPFIIGLISSAASITLFISRIPGSYLADVHGRRWIITRFTYLVAFVQIMFIFAPDWRFILVAVVLENIFLVYQPALNAMVADLIPEDRRGVGFAIVNILPSIFSIFSPAIGAYIVSRLGLVSGVRTIFLIVFIMYIISAVLRHLYLEETLESPKEVEIGLRDIAINSLKSMYDMWRESPKSLKVVILLLMLSSIEDPIFMNYASLYVFDVVGLSEYEWGLLITLYMALVISFSYPSGKIVDIFGRKAALILGYLFTLPGLILILSPEIPYSIWIGLSILTFPSSLFNPAYSALITDLTPKDMRGRVFGLIGNLNIISMAISSPIAGYLYELSPYIPFQLILILNIVILILIYLLLDDRV